MKIGEIWIHKIHPWIYFKIIGYKKNDNWLIMYANVVSTDGDEFDIMSGEEIFEKYYKDSEGFKFPEELNYDRRPDEK